MLFSFVTETIISVCRKLLWQRSENTIKEKVGGRENSFKVGGNTCPCLSGRVNNDKLDLIEESKALSITLHYNSLQCRALLSQSVLSRPDVTFWNELRRFDKSSSPRNFLIASLSINRSCRNFYHSPLSLSLSFAKYSQIDDEKRLILDHREKLGRANISKFRRCCCCRYYRYSVKLCHQWTLIFRTSSHLWMNSSKKKKKNVHSIRILLRIKYCKM